MAMEVPNCLQLLRQEVWRAFSRAWAKTGKRIAARMAIMAITTSNSIKVNPEGRPAVLMRCFSFYLGSGAWYLAGGSPCSLRFPSAGRGVGRGGEGCERVET